MTDVPRQEKNTVYYLKRITGTILLLALAFTFLYSAYTKSGVIFNPSIVADGRAVAKASGHQWMMPIGMMENTFLETSATANAFDSFQWTFLDLGINSMLATGIIARLMIGFELLMGLFLLFHIYLRRFTYKAVITVLSVFIIYLLIVIARQGNTGNCGCFGDTVAMKPLTAIWKNVAMIAATVALMYLYPVRAYKYQEYLCLLLGLVAFSTPFVVNPMMTSAAPAVYKDKPVLFDSLYSYTPPPPVDIRKGKHIVAFMSLTCPHCKKAAYLLQVIHHQHPDIPMLLILNGHKDFEKKFFDETHAEDVPHMFFNRTNDFMAMSGPGVPSIYWVNNGIVEYKSVNAYYQLDPKFMEEWIHR